MQHNFTTTGSDNLKTYYKATRFITGKNSWPPEQPKHFTPVVLVRQEGRRSKKVTEAMAAATSMRNTFQDLQEVFSLLEQPSDSQHHHTILVEGSPGVGKSVLLKHITYLWANGELLTNTEFLFLLHLRDPSVQQINSIDTLVHYFYHHDTQAKQVAFYIAQDGGKSVTILLDGSIVVSSRPHASLHLRHNISCQVEILGFSEQDQQHFIEHSLEGQPHKISELKEYLKHQPAIGNLCFIPLNMTILLLLYKDKEERPLPSNCTGLYNFFICLTIYRHLVKSGHEITPDEEITDLNSLPQPIVNSSNSYRNLLSKL